MPVHNAKIAEIFTRYTALFEIESARSGWLPERDGWYAFCPEKAVRLRVLYELHTGRLDYTSRITVASQPSAVCTTCKRCSVTAGSSPFTSQQKQDTCLTLWKRSAV